MLHGVQHGGIVEQQAGAAHRAGALSGRLLGREPAVGRDEHVARRNVEHARRHDLVPVARGAGALEREEVQQHLQPHAVPHVRERERLAPGLVIDDAQVELAVVQPAVHAVGHAAHVERHLAVRERDRRDLLGVCEVELKIQRHKVARAQLVRHVGHDLPHLLAQAAEEVGKARGFLLKVVEFVVDVALRPAVGESTELLVRHGGKTAGLRHVLRRVLQDVVEERADLRRVERRRAAGLGPEPVLQEVRIPAGGKALGLRRREVQPPAVERAHALGRETAAGGVRRARERGERGGVVPIEPRARRDGGGVSRPAQRAPGQLQRRGRGQQTLRVRVHGARQRAEELRDARDEKRRACGRAIAVKERVRHRERLRRERHALVDEVILAPERVVRAAADVELQLQQLAPLLGRKHAVRLAGARQPVVRRAEHDQVPDATAAHAVEVAGGHAVERDGDRADVVAGEHAQKQRRERVGVHLRAAEDGGKLLERADRQLPELGILGRERGAPLGAQAFGQRIEPLRQVQPLEEIRQRHGLCLRRGGGAALRPQ